MMKREEFREDLHRSVAILEAQTGKKVKGHRAARWSMVRQTLWAMEILADEGLEYDSSIYPTSIHSFGLPECPAACFRVQLPSGRTIVEYPAQILKLGPLRIPAAGGFYLRMLPLFASKWALAQSDRRGSGGMVYLHPYDLDADVPRLTCPPMFRVIRYYNVGKAESYLRRLTSAFPFSSVADLIQSNSLELPIHSFNVRD
jgi:polysaccharide deacetylase family protein (PEP-CTERM system associated)